jgi:Tfp pilus assembly protein PilO
VTDGLKSWLHDNQTLVYFLLAQAIAIGAAVLSITAYMVRLETRVATLETRGSPHLAVIDNRLTVLEKATENNKQSIDRVVEIMLRELPLKKDGTAR